MKKRLFSRLLSMLLVVALMAGFALPAMAADKPQTQKLRFEAGSGEAAPTKLSQALEDAQADTYAENRDEETYAPTDTVRVSIVMKDEPAVARFSLDDIGENATAQTYRQTLKSRQNALTQRINSALHTSIDVVWNLTLAANLISANVRYDQIDAIKAVDGVADVVIENRYEPMVKQTEAYDPNMATSSAQIGSNTVWAAGYTGAGSKVAIIDTGIDTGHQSFSAAGYDHAMTLLAEKAGTTLDAYKKSIGVLDADGIASVFSSLNIAGETTAAAVSLNDKIPFAFNYVDSDTDVTHVHDEQGEHGSHVSGIAAANRYIANADGTFSDALETARVQGVAPDAQLVVMKVFGKTGGAYDSDYMAAIEDAIVLNCDSINLSLGSADPGFTRTASLYESIFAGLTEKGAVISISAGNSGDWAENSGTGFLYGNDVSFHTGGSPGTYTNALTVASVDNAGTTGNYFSVGGEMVFYSETTYSNAALTTISGKQDYVFLPNTVLGNAEDFTGIDVSGKVVFITRGSISFVDKVTNAVNAGAKAVVIYNNQPGTINMDLTNYTGTAPAVSITEAEGDMVLSHSDEADGGAYYTGKMQIAAEIGTSKPGTDYGISDFSSWGVPGSLELKPEIAAPGGNIYSVNGTHVDKGQTLGGSDAYENMSGTSMAAPQIAGMAALLGQYIRENAELSAYMSKNNVTSRQLINSLLMSTAAPVIEAATDLPYSVLSQGAGLANVANAVNAESYIMMDSNLSGTASDGKVKAELGDDPSRTGTYTVGFTIYNISGKPQRYNVYTDLFTQDLFEDSGMTYLDTWVSSLDAEFTYNFSDHAEAVSGFACDVNRDGKTDALDAQAIISYTAGETDGSSYNLAIADLNGDGKVTTYDAHLLLVKLKAAAIEVPVGDKVHVSVTMKLTDAQKQALNAAYENGAYVEGYIYVQTDNTSDGALRPVHSIPVLGFYGNWSDAPMIDGSTLVENLYGTGVHGSYIGYDISNGAYGNYTAIQYPGDSTASLYTVNPYIIEENYPEGREAISGNSVIREYGFSLIRNAAALATYVKLPDGSVTVSSVNNQISSMFYYPNSNTWQNYGFALGAAVSPAALGLNEGDQFSAGLVMVPEYYEQNGLLTADQISQLISSGTLGHGAYMENTFTVDNTAPELLDAEKNTQTGELTLTMKDNQYIAYINIFKGKGSVSLGVGQPDQTTAGETSEVTFALSDQTAGEYVTVVIADYAGNESSYYVYYGGEPEVYTGRMFGFTSSDVLGSGKRWVEIDPATVSYDPDTDIGVGLVTVTPANVEVYAETYAAGYVFYAADDGIYATEQGEWADGVKVADYSALGKNEFVADMAYNAKDQNLYFITETGTDRVSGRATVNGSKLFRLDPKTGAVTKVADVTVDAPSVPANNDVVKYDGYKSLHAMTIDTNGNFYATNFGASYSETSNYIYLYKWTLDDVASGKLALTPVADKGVCDGTGETGKSVRCTGYSSMAYDAANDRIYLAAGFYGTDTNGNHVNTGDKDNELWVLDPTTGKASLANSSNALLYAHVKGVYFVSDSDLKLEPTDTVSAVQLSESKLTLMEGASYTLRADVYPWLSTKRDVTWTSSDDAVASVANGVVTAHKAGSATITAASAADASKSASCTVTVKAFPNVTLNAAIYDTDSHAYWASFNTKSPDKWTKLAGTATEEIDAAALNDGVILARAGTQMLSIDPETFAVTKGATLTAAQRWSDAAESPTVLSADDEEALGDMVAIANNGTAIETLDANGVKDTFTFSQFANDPMAVIAYRESGSYNLGYYETGANFFYILTESGKLYELTLYPDIDLDSYDYETVTFAEMSKSLGDTGLKLPNVSKCHSGNDAEPDYARASMIYDKASNYLLIAAYTAQNEAANSAVLYAVSPADKMPIELGSFGTSVWPVIGLYRADAASSTSAQAANKTTGTLSAAKLTRSSSARPQSISGSGSTVADGTMTVTLTEDVAVTNGKYTVKYDPAKLTLESTTSPATVKAFHIDETAGEITFAFAAAEPYAPGKTLASFTFRYRSNSDADVTLSTVERNEETVTGDSKDLPLHEWVVAERQDPTCTQTGYIKYTCTTCEETRTEILPALGHDPVTDRNGNRVCARCGKLLSAASSGSTGSSTVSNFPFVDVSKNDACYDAVKYLYEKNIMNGVDSTHFAPEKSLTRAMVVTILYRLDGEEAVSFKGVFNDVPAGLWYSNAVEWAEKHNIVNGVGNGKFSPTGEITREQLSAIIMRYAQYKGVTIYEPTSSLASTAKVSAWAKDNVAWAVSEGILSTAQAADAVKSATRAEVAMAIYTYMIKTAAK